MFGDPNSPLSVILPFLFIIPVIWFFTIRPQQQKAKEHKALLAALRRGDRVVTGGGIVGTIAKVVSDDELLVDIADNVRVRVVRSTITGVLAKTEPVQAKSDEEKGKDKEEDEKGKSKGGRRAAGGG
jgi:preprotein translocase subunit YajC